MPALPKEIEEILGSLGGSESKRVKDYIASLHAEIEKLGGTVETEEATDEATEPVGVEDDGFGVPQYKSGEDYEKQSDFKQKAADAKNSGNLDEALECYNSAVQAAPPSALLYANRAIVLEKLGHYKAAEVDCQLALEQNPDSAKALKTRGKLRYKHLDDWEGALRDLSQAQSIDFDPEIGDILKELVKKRVEKEKEEAQERIENEEALRKKAEEVKRAREEAKREEAAEASARSAGMGGMPGGMGGMPGGMGGAGRGWAYTNQNESPEVAGREVLAAVNRFRGFIGCSTVRKPIVDAKNGDYTEERLEKDYGLQFFGWDTYGELGKNGIKKPCMPTAEQEKNDEFMELYAQAMTRYTGALLDKQELAVVENTKGVQGDASDWRLAIRENPHALQLSESLKMGDEKGVKGVWEDIKAGKKLNSRKDAPKGTYDSNTTAEKGRTKCFSAFTARGAWLQGMSTGDQSNVRNVTGPGDKIHTRLYEVGEDKGTHSQAFVDFTLENPRPVKVYRRIRGGDDADVSPTDLDYYPTKFLSLEDAKEQGVTETQFRAMDSDGDGQITQEEYKKWKNQTE